MNQGHGYWEWAVVSWARTKTSRKDLFSSLHPTQTPIPVPIRTGRTCKHGSSNALTENVHITAEHWTDKSLTFLAAFRWVLVLDSWRFLDRHSQRVELRSAPETPQRNEQLYPRFKRECTLLLGSIEQLKSWLLSERLWTEGPKWQRHRKRPSSRPEQALLLHWKTVARFDRNCNCDWQNVSFGIALWDSWKHHNVT